MRGKLLNIAINTGTADAPVWKTIAQATSQKLTVSNQLGDTKTKDVVGKAKQVTGRSYSISTENLICNVDGSGHDAAAIHIWDLANTYLKTGTKVKLMIATYQAITTDGETHTKVKTLLTCDALVTKCSANFPHKENSSYSAEFAGVGAYTVGED